MQFRDYGEWLLSQTTEDSSSTTAPEAPFATEPGLASLVPQRLPTVNGASLDGCMKGVPDARHTSEADSLCSAAYGVRSTRDLETVLNCLLSGGR